MKTKRKYQAVLSVSDTENFTSKELYRNDLSTPKMFRNIVAHHLASDIADSYFVVLDTPTVLCYIDKSFPTSIFTFQVININK